MNCILKWLLALCLLVVPVLSAPDAGAPKTILTSFYPMYIMALNVAHGVPGVRVENLTKPQTGCLHDYQLTPQDMKKLTSAWSFVVNGADMELFLDKAVKQQPQLKIIEASKGIELIENPCTGHHDHDHDHGHNPHVWVSISGAIAQVRNIRDGLVALDPANGDRYRTNADAYVAKLEQLRVRMHEGLRSISSRNIITFHEAFPYFAKEFGLTIVAVIEREPGSAPSAGELAQTIKIVKKHNVKALFAEPQYPAKAAQTIAQETGLKLYYLDPAVTGANDRDAYLRIMESNLAVLQEALR